MCFGISAVLTVHNTISVYGTM